VKYPEKGKVKVRLTHHLQKDVVVGLYRNFILDILSMFDRLGLFFIVYFDPPTALQKFQMWLGVQIDYFPQIGIDLGEKLSNSFEEAFSRGFKKVIAIASDVPDLPEKILLEARDALKEHDAVLGPSPDGGYYLIGFQRTSFLSRVFEGIEWSTEAVFRDTCVRLKDARQDVYVLDPWTDVDTLEDLRTLIKNSKNSNFRSSNTMEYVCRYLSNLVSNKQLSK
jgi:rSAM/selenodomain-associated transferase 1